MTTNFSQREFADHILHPIHRTLENAEREWRRFVLLVVLDHRLWRQVTVSRFAGAAQVVPPVLRDICSQSRTLDN
jgi:hypothetical protein